MSLTPAQRAKMAQRLTLNHDRSDLGQQLPGTAAALALPADSAFAQGRRAAALAEALLTERLVVAVPVETHPDHSGEHKPQGLGEEDEVPLPVVAGEFGPSVLAFTSAEQLAQWDPAARPMTMSAQKVAVAATQVGAPPSITVDAASEHPVVLPVGAVHALVGGGRWLAPWEDQSLALTLLQSAEKVCAEVVVVQIVPGPEASGAPGVWSGELEVRVLFQVAEGSEMVTQRERLANALGAVGASPRLVAAAPSVVLVPRPVFTA